VVLALNVVAEAATATAGPRNRPPRPGVVVAVISTPAAVVVAVAPGRIRGPSARDVQKWILGMKATILFVSSGQDARKDLGVIEDQIQTIQSLQK